MTDGPPTKDLSALLFTREEAAQKLNISLRSVDEQIARGNLPVSRIGRAVRIRPSAIDFLIEANESRLSAKRRKAIRGAGK